MCLETLVSNQDNAKPNHPLTRTISNIEPVYMDDSYNALRYLLYNQVLRRQQLNSTQLDTFWLDIVNIR